MTVIGLSPSALAVALVLLAVFVGSFLGVLIRRLPLGQKIGFDRSRCEACGRALGPTELLPILSYLVQRGRCRQCGARISPEHLAIELTAVLVPLWAMTMDDGERLIAGCILGWSLLALGWIDAKTFLLPDALTLPLILLGLGWQLYAEPENLLDFAGGAALGYLLFRAVMAAYRRLRGREGLGMGDAKLLAAAGAWVGASGLGLVVFLAAIAGLAVAAVQRLRGQAVSAATMIPFGPPLALGIWLTWLYGMDW